MEKNKKRNKITIIFTIVGVLIIILGICFFAYKIVSLKENQEDNNIPEEVIKEDNKTYTLNLKHDNYGNICDTESCGEDYNETYIIKTETKDAKFLTIDKNRRFILLEDNGLKIYDLYKEEESAVNYQDYKDYDRFTIASDLDKVFALTFDNTKDNYTTYYDYLEQKVIKEKNEKSGTFLSKDYLETRDEEIISLIDIKTDKVIVSDDFKDGVGASYEVYNTNNNVYFHEYCESEFQCSTLYTKEGKKIIDLIEAQGDFTVYDGYLYVVTNNEIQKYDEKGTLVSSNKDYKNIMGINNKYILTNENNKLMLIDYIKNEKTEIMDWKEDYQSLSWDYYSNNVFKVKELKAGSYLEFSDKSFNKYCYYYNHENNNVEKIDCK